MAQSLFHSTKRPRGVVPLLLLLSAAWCAGPVSAQVVAPGEVLSFTEPDGGVIPDDVSGTTSTFLLGVAELDGVTPPARPPTAPVTLGSFAFADAVLSRGATEIASRIDFHVADDGGQERVLLGRISGQVDVRGFLALVALGQAELNVTLEVLDVTEPVASAIPRIVVHTESIAGYELMGSLSPGMSGSASATLGSATIGQVGVGIGGSLGIQLQKRVVRDSVSFGFDVLLQRGHRYRIRLVSTSQVKMGVGGGLGFASFTPDREIPPNIFEPQVWLNSMDAPLFDRGLRNLNLPRSAAARFSFPEIDNVLTTIGAFDVGIRYTPMFNGLNSTTSVVNHFDLPPDLRQALLDFYGDPTGRIEEGIATPGVHFNRLEVLLQQDASEQIDDLSDQVEEVSQQVEELKEIILRHPPFSRPGGGPPDDRGSNQNDRRGFSLFRLFR